MLDSGIARMGLFAFVFLIAFAGIISLMPNEMNSYGYDYQYGNPKDKIPDSWNGISLGGYNFTDSWNFTISTDNQWFADNDIGGRNLRFYSTHNYLGEKYLILTHLYGFGLLWEEDLNWFNKNNEQVSYLVGIRQHMDYTALNENFEEFGNMEFEVICEGLGSGSTYFKMITLFSFNTTLYSTPTLAWDNSALEILIGINAENTNYQKDIWNIISNLLTFNTVAIFGTNELYAIVLNGIISAIIYSAVIIFATAVILEVLPF